MVGPTLLDPARRGLDAARAKNIRIVTAESCTGGLIAGLLTEIPGSSDVVERGFVTYSNEAKQEALGVPCRPVAQIWRGVRPCRARHGRRRAAPCPRAIGDCRDRHRRARRRQCGKAGRPRLY